MKRASCGATPSICLLPDARREFDGFGVALTGNKPLVHRKADQQVDHFQSLDQLRKMRRLVLRDVGTEYQNRDFNALDVDLLADGSFEIALHVLHQIRDHVEQVVRDLVNGKMCMDGHAVE